MDTHNDELLANALRFVTARYHKMLYVNFTNGTFETIVFPQEEFEEIKDCHNINELVKAFINSDRIYPSDIEDFKSIADIDKLRHWIADSNEPYYGSYRRLDKGTYKYVYLGIVRDTINYDKDHEFAFVFIKDINSLYQKEYDRFMCKVGMIDTFTGLPNKEGYERDIATFKGDNVGVIFCDINGLKHCNDTQGHTAGDKLILDFTELLKSAFPDYKIYRRSGDEFIVVAYDKNLREFTQRVLAWKSWLAGKGEHPIASIGYALGINVTDVNKITTKAENEMYTDKSMFYEMFPLLKR